MKSLTCFVVATFLMGTVITSAFAGAVPLSDQEMEQMTAGAFVETIVIPDIDTFVANAVGLNLAINIGNIVQINVCAICGEDVGQTNAAGVFQPIIQFNSPF